MSNYKCTRSFKSKNGKNYYYGNKIGESEYCRLYTYEQGNFQREYEETGYSNNTSSNNSDSYSPPIDLGSMFDSDSNSSSSSDSSNFDFGGGDGGGGGATGDW
jgi:uncharacterized membrane protein YgcG